MKLFYEVKKGPDSTQANMWTNLGGGGWNKETLFFLRDTFAKLEWLDFMRLPVEYMEVLLKLGMYCTYTCSSRMHVGKNSFNLGVAHIFYKPSEILLNK